MQHNRQVLDVTASDATVTRAPALLTARANASPPIPPSDDETSSMHRCAKDVRHRAVRPDVEIALTYAGIALTLVASALVCRRVADAMHGAWTAGAFVPFVLESVLLGVVLTFIYGSLVYQLSRRGYFRRLREHRPPRLNDVVDRFDADAPAVTILVPSYKEDIHVVRATLLSAALQHYPARRVVLLLDDPPNPRDAGDAGRLAAARALPGDIMRLLEPPRLQFARLCAVLEAEVADGPVHAHHALRVARLYEEAASWFSRQASSYLARDAADTLFVEATLHERARHLRARAQAWRQRGRRASDLSTAAVQRACRDVARLFDVEVTSFERKRYENLSHAPNKAMNLNSYIAIAGRRVREVVGNGSLFLVEDPDGTLVPEPRYFVTLDADSVIVPDYVLRLVDVLERPGAERVGVIQTPYSAFPAPPRLLEHVAGATTDIQHIIHQGLTAHDATYWVGANAVLRTAALRDIAVAATERGFPVVRYIQDRTVIEDTESSIDLAHRGWMLVNFPERLSYSATPSDFGSLLIQRRRWANGGLLILPKFVAYVMHRLRGRGARTKLAAETFFRLHYLISLAATNIGLLLVLAVPAPNDFFTLWLPVSAVPYYVLYGRDLLQAGYGWRDPFRVYALNLLLVPVHLGGVFKSLEQAWTGKQIPFHRTPKVVDRTAPPFRYAVAELALLTVMIAIGVFHLVHRQLLSATFALANAAFLLYGITVLVGWADVRLAFEASENVHKLRRAVLLLRTEGA